MKSANVVSIATPFRYYYVRRPKAARQQLRTAP